MIKAVAALLLAATAANAQPYLYVYKTQDITIRLLGASCPHAKAAAILEPHSKLPLREAEVTRRSGARPAACWVLLEDGNVFLATNSDELGLLHYSKFTVDEVNYVPRR